MIEKLGLAGPGSKYKQEGADPAGFWAGWWHGMISPLALIISFFKPEVGIYETNNTGRGYDIGFVLGTSPIILKGINVNVGDDDEDEEEDDEA